MAIEQSNIRGELIAATLAIVCFLNILPNDYANDGIPIVQLSEKVNEPGQWRAIWTTDYWSRASLDWRNRDLLYRPMAVSSYRIVRVLAGPAPWPQHLANLLLHALACALIVRLACRAGMSGTASIAAGVVFAVLPIHTEVLANIVGRADLLATCGLLVTLLCQRRMILAMKGPGAIGWGLAAGVGAFIAMSAKESAVALVVVTGVFDCYWLQTVSVSAESGWQNSPDPNGPAARQSRRVGVAHRWLNWATLARLGSVVIPTVLYLGLRFRVLGGQLHQKPTVSKSVNVLVDAPLWQHWLGVVQLWGMYWSKMYWPKVLNVTYSINEIRLATSFIDPQFLLGVAMGAALVVWSVIAWRRGNPLIGVLTLCLIIAYAPTSNAFILMQAFFAERIWFLPSIFVAMLFGTIYAAFPSSRLRRFAAIALVIGMTARCWLRNLEWKDNGTLYAAAYRDGPNSIIALISYGNWLAAQGRYDDAIELLNRAVQIDFGSTDTHRALGFTYLDAGKYEDALRHLQIANMQVPNHPPTMQALEQVSRYWSDRMHGEFERLHEAADQRPDDPQARLALIRALRELGRTQEAMDELTNYDNVFAGNFDWNLEFAATAMFLDRADIAIERYRQCVNLSPDNVKLLIEYTTLLLDRREGTDIDEAWSVITRAAQLAPNDWRVLMCRGELNALKGDLPAAIALYRQALDAIPPGSEQRPNLEERLKALGG